MSTESLWYQSYRTIRGHDGPYTKPPHCERLARKPMPVQWQMAIDMAVEWAAGLAGHRNTNITLTGEVYWYRVAPDGAVKWWIIPRRVEKRIFALHEAAMICCMRRGRGRCSPDEITACLEAWRRNGHWRSVAAKVYPRHEAAGPTPKGMRRLARMAKYAAAAHELRYSTLVGQSAGFRVRCRPADVESLRDLFAASMDEEGELCELHIDRLRAAGAIVEAVT